MSLPKGYKRLEYIQSSGTQYVDTLFAPNQDTRVVADVQMMSEVSSGGANEIFGARTSASSKAYAVQWNTTGAMFQHFYNAGYDNLDFGNFSERQIVETNKNVLLINGVTHERPYAAFQCDYTLYLCAVNQENAAKFFSAMRVYVCQIYDNGTLVRDYIPCVTDVGEVGLWDNVEDKFYGNAGTGSFIGFAIYKGTVLDFPYVGNVEELTLPAGKYLLECWGAQGGSYSSYLGGRGGYARGVLTLTAETTVFCRAGGQPATGTTNAATVPGGFNGGGAGFCRTYSGTSTYGQGGGGASDIRIGEDSLYARVIVAGGGGGSASIDASTTKYGGGESGGSPVSGYGATQLSAGTNGSFGQGASCAQSGGNYKYGSGGGGGGWYGGGSIDAYNDNTNYRGYNGGGSGFVWTGANPPNGYLLTEEHYLTDTQNIAGNQAFASPDNVTETGHSGNGFVRITVLELTTILHPPEAPETFQIDSASDTTLNVSWGATTNTLGYKLWVDGRLVTDTVENTATVTVEPFARMVLSLVAYNDDGNSPAVTLTHQYTPDNPVLWLVTDRTSQDVSLGNAKGTYNASDLNRVGYAVVYLADKLASCGVKTTVHPKTDWMTTDIPSEQVLVTYLQNVRTLRTALTLVASVPEVPQDMQFFTHTEANSIEMLLVMLDTHITNMLSNVDTSWAIGSTYTGLYAKEAYR